MVEAFDVVQIIARICTPARATIVSAAHTCLAASSRVERVRLGDQDFPHERDQIIRTKWSRLSTTSAAQVTAFVDGGGAFIGTDTDTDSHGVSDPSGEAQGHWQCAHRGRSRHGFLP